MDIGIAELRTRIRTILEGHGLKEADAVAGLVVENELRGRDGIGMLPHLLAVLPHRRDPECRRLRDAGAALLLDASGRPGPLAALEATALAGRRARAHGVALVGAVETGTLGALGVYAELLAREGLLALLLASTPRAVVPHGGREGMLGTNPFCLAAGPVVADFTTASMTFRELARAAAANEPLPEGCALDAEGRPTRDPLQAMRDGIRLLPLAGHRGSALALSVEILAAALLGGAVGKEKSAGFEPAHFSLLVLAVDPAALGVDLQERVQALVSDLGTHYPGEGSSRRREDGLRRGTVEVAEDRVRLLADLEASPT